MGIAPELRKPRDGVEKYLLRKAFEGVIPDPVLWRPKEAFSDGCSDVTESWSTIIQEFVNQHVSDEELAESSFDHCSPRTKEEAYYRKHFEAHYPGRAPVVPAFWMPKWCGEDVVDPSARVLSDVYRASETPVSKAPQQRKLITDAPQPVDAMKETG